MKKTLFTNKPFYYLFIGYLILLLSYNIYSTITLKIIYGILPISIQTTLLIFIFTKSKHAKLLIQIWTIVFMIIATGLQFFGQFLTGMGNNFENFMWNAFVYKLIELGIGILILSYTNKTVKVSFPETTLNLESPQENIS